MWSAQALGMDPGSYLHILVQLTVYTYHGYSSWSMHIRGTDHILNSSDAAHCLHVGGNVSRASHISDTPITNSAHGLNLRFR